jgi:transposase-like protein
MTDEKMTLFELIQKADSTDFLKELAETTLQRLMEFQVDDLCGASRHERCGERSNYRNGHRARMLETRLGTLDLKIPKLRTGSYFPPFLEARKTGEQSLVAVIQEAWIQGVSTRKVDDLVQSLGMSGISKSQVSKLCEEIDGRVNDFLNRPITGAWPYLWLDATYLKVRQGGRIVSVAVIIATAVNTDGRREILGLGIGPSEAAVFWGDFLRTLKKRGLAGVKLVISDSHEGLKAAINQVLGATWQRCRVHFMRNLLAYAPKGQHSMIAAAVRTVFTQPDRATAGEAWRHVADQLRQRFPKLAAVMDEAEHDVLAFMDFPRAHWPKIYSTNPLERLNKEVKRRANVVGIFPNEPSIRRLVGAILLEQNDEWQLQHRYLTLETMAGVAALDDSASPALLKPSAA